MLFLTVKLGPPYPYIHASLTAQARNIASFPFSGAHVLGSVAIGQGRGCLPHMILHKQARKKCARSVIYWSYLLYMVAYCNPI